MINIFSDSAASQFKQRYLFSNLYEWQSEFSIQLIWNFFATSHGKGAVDGIGGSVKRCLEKDPRNCNSSTDAESYAAVAMENNPNITVIFVSSEVIKRKSAVTLPI